jgi:hypothetical protein
MHCNSPSFLPSFLPSCGLLGSRALGRRARVVVEFDGQ